MISMIILTIIILIIQTNSMTIPEYFLLMCSQQRDDNFLYLLETFKSVMKETCSSGMYFDYNTTNEIYSSFTVWNYIQNEYIFCNYVNGTISTKDNSKECQ